MLTNELLRKRYRLVRAIVFILSLYLIYIVFFHKPNYYEARVEHSAAETAEAGNTLKITSNTARICGRDMYETICAITSTAYPSSHYYDRPNAVILVKEENKTDGILAARLTHNPIDAPILFTSKDALPERMLQEIRRLKPKGISGDRNVQVLLIGDMGGGVKAALKKEGLKYRQIGGENPYELARRIDEYITTLHGQHSRQIVIAPVEMPESGLIQTAWAAQSGDAFFFIEEDNIPEEVRLALERRNGNAYIYLLGDRGSVSTKVAAELSRYGHVQKVPGAEDIYSQSAAFALYRHTGKSFNKRLNESTKDFGFGITAPGHSFIFINPQQWQTAVTSSILAHKGKVGPMLLIREDIIPPSVREYLKLVQPDYISPQNQLNNHGWIIGNEEHITNSVQAVIDMLLDYDRSELQ
jgi:hypothetical protein